MAKKQHQKLKLLLLKDYLQKNTDEEHGVTLAEITAYLGEQDISAERKSLYSDIELLRDVYKMDIIRQKNDSRFEYKLMSRDFDLHELKLLCDAVESSKFITDKKSTELITKLKTLCSRHEAEALSRQVLCGKVKNMNESIYYSVDTVFDAIRNNRCIRFRYFNYTFTKEKEYRRGGEFYEVSPYSLTYSEEKYYLIAYDFKNRDIRHFRVDRMENIEQTQKARNASELFSDIDLTKYTDMHFSMFGGEVVRVRLEFDLRLAGAFFDRFGTDTAAIHTAEDKYEVSVNVAVSEQFFGWLAGLGGGARVVAPKEVRAKYRDFLEKAIEQI